MKIGVVYTSSYSKINGMSASSRRVRDICRGLTQAGSEVILFIPKRLNAEIEQQESDQFRIECIKGYSNNKIIDRILFFLKTSDYINVNVFDCVIYYSPTIDCVISMLFLNKNVKKLIEVSDLVSEGIAWRGTLKGAIFKLGEKYLPKFCDGSISISSKISNYNKNQNPKIKDFILPVLVDTEKFVVSQTNNQLREILNIPGDALIVGYSGGTYIEYGLNIFIEAFSQINLKKEVRLVIAGKLIQNDSKYTNLEKLVQENGLNDKVHLLGWVNDEMVIKLLNGADILCVPHLDLPINNSGLPTKLAEYAIIEKPILSTDLGDISKYFKHKFSIYLIKGSSVEEMNLGLVELLSNDVLRKTIAENSKKIALETFDYKYQGVQLKNFIESKFFNA